MLEKSAILRHYFLRYVGCPSIAASEKIFSFDKIHFHREDDLHKETTGSQKRPQRDHRVTERPQGQVSTFDKMRKTDGTSIAN
ncbi:MAG: hypothetical protein COW52_05755 [Nitrospirae bacterium CG17_big_fil_post_rev_8_21_14_2_50_50_9]|nr:MAG: hypothetical protein COW52_05755 [Nitrospirae bacterium CG17_big_fil_post_rev_8_21_14_2_50_50_9]